MKTVARMKIQFNKRQLKAIETMAKSLDTDTAGVLRIALAFLQTAICERKNGNSLGVIQDGIVIKEIVNF